MTRLVSVQLAHSKPSFAALALLSHFVFHTGEWDNDTHIFFLIWSIALSTIGAAEWFHSNSINAAIQTTVTAAVIYFGTLMSSILVHRIMFHRLRKFPGPFMARVSKLYAVIVGVSHTNRQFFRYSDELHKKYKSDYIRSGPRELLVYSADAIPLVHGATSKCTKSPWYAATKHVDATSTQTTRDKSDHKQRRKLWDQAFSTKALRNYEPRLNKHALALMSRLKEQAKDPSIRISNWLNYYGFDVMGDIGFSRSFGMVEKGEEDPIIKMLHESMSPLSFTNQMPWLLSLVTLTKAGAKPIQDHLIWTRDVMRNRVEIEPQEKDITSYLIDPEKPEVTPGLNSDSRLLVVAGSDTTSATLTFITYELCKSPAVQTKLRSIIDAIEPGKPHLDCEDVANIPFLDGVIQEGLRLHPAVPGGVSRETPPEGLTMPDGTYIPGKTIIWMPIWAIQRDERYFESALEFMPERWTDERPSAVRDKRAFMPFSAGAYNCVGQKLAMMEMRTVVANLVRLFDIKFAEGEDGRAVEMESQDCFTTNVGKLDVKLTPRY